MDSRIKKYSPIAAVALFAALGVLLLPGQSYRYRERPLPATFEEFYQSKLAASRVMNTRAGNEERLVRNVPGRSRAAFLYIHGFGASRAEGEEVMDKIAGNFKANLYYVRLPGHGTNPEDHASHTFDEYLDEGEISLRMMPQIGEKIFLVGTSMGGLISTYLAADRPDLVAGLILAAPFFDFMDSIANLAGYPGGVKAVELIAGASTRDNGKHPGDPNDTRIAGFENYWYTRQYFSAIQSLVRLKMAVNKPEILARVHVPVLMIYYYKDEEHQDNTASVPAMLESFHRMGGDSPHPLNRAAAIAGGSHVLMSRWVPTDKALIEKHLTEFINDVLVYAPQKP